MGNGEGEPGLTSGREAYGPVADAADRRLSSEVSQTGIRSEYYSKIAQNAQRRLQACDGAIRHAEGVQEVIIALHDLSARYSPSIKLSNLAILTCTRWYLRRLKSFKRTLKGKDENA